MMPRLLPPVAASLAFACSASGGAPDRTATTTAATAATPPSPPPLPHLFSPTEPSFLFLLIDDVGWSDLGYNGGTARTPHIDSWATSSGSLILHDFHSGGTVCSPTRATVLTGRNHFRDCVDYVYGCSDMSTCVPDFEFAPMHTFTVGGAARAATGTAGTGTEYDGGVYFAGKWHLGSFYDDSEAYGGRTSSPMTHGFDHMNATVEVAPTAAANCQCRPEWEDHCDFGHYHSMTHCSGTPTPEKCCFNYWWDDPLSPHGVTNLTWPSPDDDAQYVADAFGRFLRERRASTGRRRRGGGTRGGGAGSSASAADADGPPSPFVAQLSFHNCHVPFIGMKSAKESCAGGETCRPPADGEPPYTDEELDYYACLTQLDAAVGRVLQSLRDEGYYDNTMVWFTSDNGPEMNCPPDGICKRANDRPHRPEEGPGSAGPLRGRKRDIYEGGHRVPGVVSWPAVIPGGTGRTSWEFASTTDFLPTVMDVLGVDRPPEQRDWAMDGRSILPILRGERWEDTPDGVRSFGIGYYDAETSLVNGWGYRHGRWKFVEGSASCTVESCRRPQLFDLDADLGERHDLSGERPDVLAAMQKNFSVWHRSVMRSRREESRCSKPRELQLPPSMVGHLLQGVEDGHDKLVTEDA